MTAFKAVPCERLWYFESTASCPRIWLSVIGVHHVLLLPTIFRGISNRRFFCTSCHLRLTNGRRLNRTSLLLLGSFKSECVLCDCVCVSLLLDPCSKIIIFCVRESIKIKASAFLNFV